MLTLNSAVRFNKLPPHTHASHHSLGPHDARLADVLGPHARRPVADGEEVLREERVPLQAVDGAEVARVGGHDLLAGRLRLPVAGDDRALLGADHELCRLHKRGKFECALVCVFIALLLCWVKSLLFVAYNRLELNGFRFIPL